MRGKKSGPDEDFNQEEDLTQTSEEDIEYFQKLQSERELLKHLNALMLMENEEYTDDMEKRAPSQGFHGMRGKKLFEQAFGWQGNDLSNQENYDQDIEKRAPSQGFHGMRGKKSVDNFDYMEYEKRAPLGFQGKTILFNSRVLLVNYFIITRNERQKRSVSSRRRSVHLRRFKTSANGRYVNITHKRLF